MIRLAPTNHRRATFVVTLALCGLLSACASPPKHRGLAADGYGFVNDSRHLPPPAHLEHPVQP